MAVTYNMALRFAVALVAVAALISCVRSQDRKCSLSGCKQLYYVAFFFKSIAVCTAPCDAGHECSADDMCTGE